MKKFLALALSLVIIFSLASCRKDIDNNSSLDNSSGVSEETDSLDLNAIMSATDFFSHYNNSANFLYPRDSDPTAPSPFLNYPEKWNWMGNSQNYNELKEKYNEFKSNKYKATANLSPRERVKKETEELPPVYEFIRFANITKEEFIKLNQNPHGNDEGLIAEGYFSEEEIEILYSDDIEAAKKELISDYAVYHNGKVYCLDYFYLIPAEEWDKGLDSSEIHKILVNGINYFNEGFKAQKKGSYVHPIISTGSPSEREYQFKAMFFKTSVYSNLTK